MKKAIILLAITLGFLTTSTAQEKTVKVELKGVYKEIDVEKQNSVVEMLNGENTELIQKTIETVLKNPNQYNPPAIYALSTALFSLGRKDEAAYWFYVAQLRARYDANLCMDKSAKQIVSLLNREYGPEINKYAFGDIKKLEKTVTDAVDFVRKNQEAYDQRWINLHGMDAMVAGMEENTEKKALSQPKQQWAEIKNKTLDEYYNGFMEFVKSKKN